MSTTEQAPAASAPSAGSPAGGSGKAPASPRPLSERHQRLARYLYAAELCRGRRLLDIGGDGEGAQLLLERGAQAAIGLVLAGSVGVQRHPGGLADIILYGRMFGLLAGVFTALDDMINGLVLAQPIIMECLMKSKMAKLTASA